MTKFKVNWRLAGIVAGCALLIWAIAGVILAGREPAPEPPGSQPVLLHGGRVTGNRISTRSWTFDYTSAQMSPDGTDATIDGVKHGILYKKGKPYLSIAAEHVMLNTQTFDFTAIGDVHIAALNPKDGISKSFDTDYVNWSNAIKRLTMLHPSLFHTGDQLLRVSTIDVDFNTNTIHLGKVEGAVEAPDK
jgi:hypothetical protein